MKLQENYLDEIELPEKIKREIEEIAQKRKLSKEKLKILEDEVKKIYLKSRFEPGEAVGIIAAHSISEPATQMSLPYEEKILIKENGFIRPIGIGKFIDDLLNKFRHKVRRSEDTEILDLPRNLNIYVYSIDSDEKLRAKRIKAVIRHKSPEKLLEIKTSSGRKIVATDHHSFVVRKDNRIVPISGRLLKVNDRIPVIKNLPENCISTISISTLISENLVRKNGYVYPYVAHSKGFPEELKLDFSLGWFIGAYLSEGTSTKFFVSILNTNEEFNTLVRIFAKKFGLTLNEYDNFRGFSKGHNLHINSILLSKFLRENCGDNSKNKKVPFFAFSANEEFLKGLLQAYFDGDGNVSIDKKGIRASSESKELLDGIALLLSRFGIFCSKSNDNKSIWIPYKYANVFYEKIGSSMSERREMLRKLSEKYKKTKRKAEVTDMIPGIGDKLVEIAKKLKYPTRYVNNFTKRQRIGRATLEKYINLFEEIAKKKRINISNEIKVLKKALNSDIVWDRIEKISYVPSNSKYVYDISVEGLETFATFDGIITHNTMRTFHIAGTAAIKVTYGLPKLVEIVDAKKTPENPEMTIYLKSKYNNEKMAIKVAEEIVERNLSDVIKKISLNLEKGYVEIEPLDGKIRKKIVLALRELKNVKVSKKEVNIIIKPKGKFSTKDLEKLKEDILSLTISPVKGITNAMVMQEGKDWVIKTAGSNLEDVLKIEEIDPTRTISTNIHEVAKVFGIEAARNLIIREIMRTLNEQGLDVDVRHVTLLADIMTYTGKIRPIGRYGIAGTKTSVLARAAFEETIKHLIKASVKGETEEFKGIFENVLIGKVTPAGTGMFELIAKTEEEVE
jgi:DNA-directed RNA polymerase subunit A"